MIKTKRKCALVFLVVVSMLFNMISLSAFAEGEVIINAKDDGTALSLTKDEPLTRSFEITEAGNYSLTVNVNSTSANRKLKIKFENTDEIEIALERDSSGNLKDYHYTGEITLESGTQTVSLTATNSNVTLKSLTLTFVSALTPPSDDDENDTPVVTEYTIEAQNYTATDISSSDIPNYDVSAERIVKIKKDKYISYEIEATKGNYKVVAYGGTANGAQLNIKNEKNSESITKDISSTSVNTNYEEIDLGYLNLLDGNQVIKVSGLDGEFWSVRLKFTRIGDYAINQIENEKKLLDADIFATESATYEDGVFTISDGGSVTFAINTPADKFNISASLKEASTASVEIYVGDTLIATKTADEIGNLVDYDFEEGEKTLKIKATGGEIKIENLKLKKVVASDDNDDDDGNDTPPVGGDDDENEDNTDDNEQPSYTKVYLATELNALETKSIDKFSPSYDYGKDALLMRANNSHYVTFTFDGDSAEYSIEIEGSTGSGECEIEIINNKRIGNTTVNSPATGSYSTFGKSTSQDKLNIAKGDSVTVKFKTGIMFMASVTFNKTGDYVAMPVYPIEDEKILSDADISETDNATYEDGVFNILENGSVSFVINTATDAFNLSASLKEDSTASLKVYVDDELIATKTANEIENIGEFVLEEGEKTLKIEAVGGEIKIENFKVKKIAPSEVKKTVIEKAVYDFKPDEDGVVKQGVSYQTSDGVDPGKDKGVVHLSNSEWVKYEIDAPEAGDYLITLVYSNYGGERVQFDNETNEKTTGSVIIAGSGGIGTYATTNVTTDGNDLSLTLNKGKNIIKYTKPNGDLNLKKLTFTLINKNMDFHALYVGGYPVLGTNLIKPSSDTMKIYMTHPITTKEKDFINDMLVITDSAGKSISYDVVFEKEIEKKEEKDGDKVVEVEIIKDTNVISLDLKDSLLPNTKYNVMVKDLLCKYSKMSSQQTISFETDDENTDGISELAISSSSISGENITIEGVLYGSHEKTINGRTLKAYISKEGSSEKTYLGETLSKDGGNVKLDLTVPEGSDAGTYTIYIEPQYSSSSKELTFTYVDAERLISIRADFKGATTLDLVKEAFSKNSDVIPYNLEDDLKNLNESDFYNHFKEYDFETIDEFYQYYDARLVFEKLKQNGASEALFNEKNCEKINVEYGKIALILNNKTDFVAAVNAISETEYDKYIAKLKATIEDYLEKETTKNDVTLILSDETRTYGQGFDKDIVVSSAQADLKKVIFKLECDTEDILDKITFTNNSDAVGNITKNGKTATVEVIYNKLYDKATLFNLTFTSTTVGTHNIKCSGNLIFDFKGYDIEKDIAASNFNIVIQDSNSNSNSTSDKTTGGNSSPSGTTTGGNSTPSGTTTGGTTGADSGVSGGVSGGETQTPDNTGKNESVSASSVFVDIENHAWAEESITALVNKGVISKPEDKKFRPNDNITREELVKMVVCLLNIDTTVSQNEFSDVKKDHWAYNYIAIASQNGLVSGMGDGSFGIGTYITREQIATIAGRILEKYNMKADFSMTEDFADETEISSYAKDSVKKMKFYGIINGVGENMFAPKANATRAETAKIIYGLAKVVGL